MKKLYVGNLNYATTADDLRQLFSEAGSVGEVSLITDRGTGQSKGFAFVEMDNDTEALAAIERFNNYELNQRNISVNEARPKTEKTFGGGGRSRSGGGGGGYGGGGGGYGGGGGGYGGGPRRGGQGGGKGGGSRGGSDRRR